MLLFAIEGLHLNRGAIRRWKWIQWKMTIHSSTNFPICSCISYAFHFLSFSFCVFSPPSFKSPLLMPTFISQEARSLIFQHFPRGPKKRLVIHEPTCKFPLFLLLYPCSAMPSLLLFVCVHWEKTWTLENPNLMAFHAVALTFWLARDYAEWRVSMGQ